MAKYLVSNDGSLVAEITDGNCALKSVQASTVTADDALNAEFPRVLVNHREYRVSGAKKYATMAQRQEVQSAKQLPDGRLGHYVIY